MESDCLGCSWWFSNVFFLFFLFGTRDLAEAGESFSFYVGGHAGPRAGERRREDDYGADEMSALERAVDAGAWSGLPSARVHAPSHLPY